MYYDSGVLPTYQEIEEQRLVQLYFQSPIR